MRWKGFITLTVIAAVLFIFCVFFLDNVIETSVEKAGTSLWGAKVEIGKVGLKLSPLGVEISGLTVASRKYEYENLIDIGSLKFAITAAPLLEKKLIIEEVSGKELAFNTERKTSGFIIKKKKEKKAESEAREKQWEAKMTSWLEDIKKRGKEKVDVVSSFKKEDLESVKALSEAEKSLNGLKDKYSGYKGPDIDAAIKHVTESIKALEKIKIEDAEDIEKASRIIADAQNSLKEADKAREEIMSSVSEFQSSVSGLKEIVDDIDDARKADYKNIMDKLKLPSIETGDIAETVFGPLVVERFKTAVSYIKKIRKYIPPKKKEEQVVKKERKRGEDIIFAKEKMYPPFHIKKALVTGENKSRIEVKDLSTTPWIIGRPVTAGASHSNFTLNASIDRSSEIPSEDFSGTVKKFRVADTEGLLEMKAGFKGEQIGSTIKWSGKGLLPADWLRYLDLEDPLVTLTVKVYGTGDDLKFSMNSNLDNIISAQLKKELEKKIQEAKKDVNSLLDKEILSRKDKLLSDKNEFSGEIVSLLNKEKNKIDSMKNELNKLIENVKEEQKKKAGDKLRKEAEEQLKKLFR